MRCTLELESSAVSPHRSVKVLISATVMPHALFIGSSLASVDRLNMQPQLPQPPSFFSRKISHKLPSLFKRRIMRTQEEEDPEADYEMNDLDGSSNPRIRIENGNAGNLEGEVQIGKDVMAGESSETLDLEMKKYEEALKGFDRIKWVDIHLRHATVSISQPNFRGEYKTDVRLTLRSACYASPSPSTRLSSFLPERHSITTLMQRAKRTFQALSPS